MLLSVARGVIAFVVALAVPSSAVAHGLGEPWIYVPADNVLQGETMTVVAADFGQNSPVALEILSAGTSYPLGEVVADADGHFTQPLNMPVEVPNGYAELRAAEADGSEAIVWILVGPLDQAGVGAPPTSTTAAWWTDPSVLLLAGLLVAGAAALGFALLRRQAPPKPAPAPGRAARTGAPRPRKARRRPS